VRSFSLSRRNGVAETQEMLDFCGDHGITAVVASDRRQLPPIEPFDVSVTRG